MSVMATANYNEVYNAVTLADGRLGADPSQKDPMFRWDTHFPERLSRLTLTPDFTAPCSGSPSTRARSTRNKRNRNAARFKTQPITFDEIKEVDEETTTKEAGGNTPSPMLQPEHCKENLKSQFAVFSRSMDGLVVSPFAKKLEDSAASASGGLTSASPLSTSQASCSSEEDQRPDTTRAAAAAATSASIQRQQFRQRRKKRHTKSIEEAPELDRIENQDGTG